MDEYEFKRRRHVPAFGSWDCNGDLPFTQCFETAREGGVLRCSYNDDDEEERDLYVAGDLYENDVFTPAMIVVPRYRGKKSERKKSGRVVWDCECEVAAAPPPKAIDEDLYKISPELLRSQSQRKQKKKKRGGWRFFSTCLSPCLY